MSKDVQLRRLFTDTMKSHVKGCPVKTCVFTDTMESHVEGCPVKTCLVFGPNHHKTYEAL